MIHLPAPLVSFVVFLVSECLVFFLATLNYRFCAKGWIKSTLVTDVTLAGLNFLIIRIVASDAATLVDMLGYIIGAGIGSYIGMRLTKGIEHVG